MSKPHTKWQAVDYHSKQNWDRILAHHINHSEYTSSTWANIGKVPDFGQEEALAYRDMSRTGEVRVPVKNITLQDLTGETKIGLWRNLSSSVINVGQYVMVTECKINKFRGDTSFNSTSKSVLLQIEAPVEVLRVMVDGHYMENEDQILVCCIKNTDTYMDYVIEEDVLRTITKDGEITELDFPAEALVSVQKVNNKDLIKLISIV